MASNYQLIAILVIIVTLLLQGNNNIVVEAQLSPTFYATSCPLLLPTVSTVVTSAIARERRMGASLLRLFYLDCFVLGCDGSILLDDTLTFKGEQNTGSNRNSVRGFNVIDNIKSTVELICPGVVSCADILAIAARDSVVLLGGPTWSVDLGRRDSTTANSEWTDILLPGPHSSLIQLDNIFTSLGFSQVDMVALSGAHTIGQASCKNYRKRIYNDTNIDPFFATARQEHCPINDGDSDCSLARLDANSSSIFDNSYFKNLIAQKGLLHSDQELMNNHNTIQLVYEYSDDPPLTFFSDFASAMIKMGRLNSSAESNGEIRKICGMTN